MTIEITDQRIQLAITIILVITLFLILLQLVVQKKLARAQLLRDRFEMYVKATEPVTNEHVEQLKLYTDDYMDIKLFNEKYENDKKAIRKYIYMAVLYEYLAFTHAMPKAKFLAPDFLEMWVSDLCDNHEFYEVHKHYRRYYPRFAKVVEKLLDEKRLGQDQSRAKVQGNTDAKSTG